MYSSFELIEHGYVTPVIILELKVSVSEHPQFSQNGNQKIDCFEILQGHSL